jgi:hypothetical protein
MARVMRDLIDRHRARRSPRAVLAVGALTAGALGWAGMASAAAVSGGATPAAPNVAPTPDSVLVIGDSIVAQAQGQTRYWAPPGATVWVAGGSGSAPCDWNAGYRDPFTRTWFQFSQLIDHYHPGAVVLAFSGNPGLSGPRAGCMDGRTRYSLGALLASYQRALVAMARYASARGVLMYLDASPPRNPATPAGAYRGNGGSHEYGFNGVPQLNQMYSAVAASPEGRADRWSYDPAAATAVSDPALRWHLTEGCAAWDLTAGNCGSGQQAQVRAGGYDAVHLDRAGAGATRYGMAVLRQPLSDEGYPA